MPSQRGVMRWESGKFGPGQTDRVALCLSVVGEGRGGMLRKGRRKQLGRQTSSGTSGELCGMRWSRVKLTGLGPRSGARRAEEHRRTPAGMASAALRTIVVM